MRWTLPLLLAAACSGADPQTDNADTGAGPDAVTVRVVTWNVEGLGRDGSEEFLATVAVLQRLDADIVALNEVDPQESGALAVLADALGLDTTFLPSSNPFGSLRNAVMTRRPVVDVSALTAAGLSGDDRAMDLTRLPVRLTVRIDEVDRELTVVSQHWKSGFNLDDRFRRTLDGLRTAQAADRGDAVVVMGDVNAQPDDMPESPSTWTSLPDGLPAELRLGADLRDLLRDSGLRNDPFQPLQDLGMSRLESLQVDGRAVTRPSSGRYIDWVVVSSDLVDGARSEIYDSTDEGQGGLDKAGPTPDRSASEAASDHLPVFADLRLTR